MSIELRPIPYEGRIGPIGLDALADAFKPHIMLKDIIVVTQKAVSYAEGRVVNLNTVTPTARAMVLAEVIESDPKFMQLVLQEGKVMRVGKSSVLTRMPNGMVCNNAGIDAFGVGPDEVCLLPVNPDASARQLSERLGCPVIISDTQSRWYRNGVVNVSIGSWGIAPIISYLGQHDHFGNELKKTVIAIADELATAADLIMGKFNMVPAVAIAGYPYLASQVGSQLLNDTRQYSIIDIAQGKYDAWEEEGDDIGTD